MAETKTKTKFYWRHEGDLLFRMRHEDALPEQFGPVKPEWRDAPWFDPIHKDQPIGADEALRMAREQHGDQISMGDLESTGDDGGAGGIYESERAPLRP